MLASNRPHWGLSLLFLILLLDLVGFGMIIPLSGLYARHYGATGWSLSLLGGSYSCMQFFFAPLWGRLSDHFGRRPILLLSVAGSSLSYLLFGLSSSYTTLLLSRMLGGAFAANIGTAQAAIADLTPPHQRTQGMGLVGAAFGIGFSLGPLLGGLSVQHLGMAAPGLLASCLCALNLLFACWKLPETLSLDKRGPLPSFKKGHWLPPLFQKKGNPLSHPSRLRFLILSYFVYILGFSMEEQTFSLFLQNRFGFDTASAGYHAGLLLMVAGLLGAFAQGLLLKRLTSCFSEPLLLCCGLLLKIICMSCFPFLPTYSTYFFLMIPLSLASSLIHPFLFSFISRAAPENTQGFTSGFTQSLGSLARSLGPFLGLWSFSLYPWLPAYGSASLCFMLLIAFVFFFFHSNLLIFFKNE